MPTGFRGNGRSMGRLSGKTAMYFVGMTLLAVAVVWLVARISRTPATNRYVETIGLVIIGAIVLGGLGWMGVRGLRERARRIRAK